LVGSAVVSRAGQSRKLSTAEWGVPGHQWLGGRPWEPAGAAGTPAPSGIVRVARESGPGQKRIASLTRPRPGPWPLPWPPLRLCVLRRRMA